MQEQHRRNNKDAFIIGGAIALISLLLVATIARHRSSNIGPTIAKAISPALLGLGGVVGGIVAGLFLVGAIYLLVKAVQKFKTLNDTQKGNLKSVFLFSTLALVAATPLWMIIHEASPAFFSNLWETLGFTAQGITGVTPISIIVGFGATLIIAAAVAIFWATRSVSASPQSPVSMASLQHTPAHRNQQRTSTNQSPEPPFPGNTGTPLSTLTTPLQHSNTSSRSTTPASSAHNSAAPSPARPNPRTHGTPVASGLPDGTPRQIATPQGSQPPALPPLPTTPTGAPANLSPVSTSQPAAPDSSQPQNDQSQLPRKLFPTNDHAADPNDLPNQFPPTGLETTIDEEEKSSRSFSPVPLPPVIAPTLPDPDDGDDASPLTGSPLKVLDAKIETSVRLALEEQNHDFFIQATEGSTIEEKVEVLEAFADDECKRESALQENMRVVLQALYEQPTFPRQYESLYHKVMRGEQQNNGYTTGDERAAAELEPLSPMPDTPGSASQLSQSLKSPTRSSSSLLRPPSPPQTPPPKNASRGGAPGTDSAPSLHGSPESAQSLQASPASVGSSVCRSTPGKSQ